MKQFTKLLFSSGIALILSSCFETVDFPVVPQIEFESIEYRDTDRIDSLVLSFRFKDGDSDVGLTNEFNDLLSPYHVYNVVLDAEDSVVRISQPDLELPLYTAPIIVLEQNGVTERFYVLEEKELLAETDVRPTYNCEDYEIINSDTIFVSRNEFHHNFHVEFQEKVNGNYETIDFRSILNSDDCTLGNYDGRIPFFDPNGKEGVITYAMLSQGFRLAFQEDTIRLQFYIYDRGLNQSNIEVTPDFVLNDLL